MGRRVAYSKSEGVKGWIAVHNDVCTSADQGYRKKGVSNIYIFIVPLPLNCNSVFDQNIFKI